MIYSCTVFIFVVTLNTFTKHLYEVWKIQSSSLFDVVFIDLLSYVGFEQIFAHNPANTYLFKDNNRDTIKRCKISLKLTIKTPERRYFYSAWNHRKAYGFMIISGGIEVLLSLSMYVFAGKKAIRH